MRGNSYDLVLRKVPLNLLTLWRRRTYMLYRGFCLHRTSHTAQSRVMLWMPHLLRGPTDPGLEFGDRRQDLGPGKQCKIHIDPYCPSVVFRRVSLSEFKEVIPLLSSSSLSFPSCLGAIRELSPANRVKAITSGHPCGIQMRQGFPDRLDGVRRDEGRRLH